MDSLPFFSLCVAVLPITGRNVRVSEGAPAGTLLRIGSITVGNKTNERTRGQFTALARPGMLTTGRDGDMAVLVLLLHKFNDSLL